MLTRAGIDKLSSKPKGRDGEPLSADLRLAAGLRWPSMDAKLCTQAPHLRKFVTC